MNFENSGELWRTLENSGVLKVQRFFADVGDIVGSWQGENESSFSLTLTFSGAPEEEGWTIHKPVKKIQDARLGKLELGISSSHAIILLSSDLPKRGIVPLPFKEAEYLQFSSLFTPEFLLIQDHMQLELHGYDTLPPLQSLPGDLPLFDSLRVLVLNIFDPQFWIGHTFPKLERCRVHLWDLSVIGHLLGLIDMPVCTRVELNDPCLLSIFKFRHISELTLGQPHDSINWVDLLVENGDLPRLNLLHLSDWSFDAELIPILRWLPLLETLIICSQKGVVSLKALLPMDKNCTSELIQSTSELTQTTNEEEILTLLCPRLQNLQIEVKDSLVQPQRIPFLKDVVSLRAEWGSPLKSFSVSKFYPEYAHRFELIGKDGGFTMEEIILPKGADGGLDLTTSDPPF